jgi:hypothetical protein
MNCRDFQRKWDELLDADAREASATIGSGAEDGRSIDESEALLLAHAAECPVCRRIAVRYQTLRRAIRVWRRPPAPPIDLVSRVLSAADDPAAGTGRGAPSLARRFLPVHAARIRRLPQTRIAAAILLFMLLGFVLYPIARQRSTDRAKQIARTIVAEHLSSSGPRDLPKVPLALDRALADATSATWDLARSASEPAARISREVLDATVQAHGASVVGSDDVSAVPRAELGEELASLSVSLRSLDPMRAESEDASGVLRLVGDQLSEGVRPLSSTARHAFGFLLGSPPRHDESRPGGTTSNGARSG